MSRLTDQTLNPIHNSRSDTYLRLYVTNLAEKVLCALQAVLCLVQKVIGYRYLVA